MNYLSQLQRILCAVSVLICLSLHAQPIIQPPASFPVGYTFVSHQREILILEKAQTTDGIVSTYLESGTTADVRSEIAPNGMKAAYSFQRTTAVNDGTTYPALKLYLNFEPAKPPGINDSSYYLFFTSERAGLIIMEANLYGAYTKQRGNFAIAAQGCPGIASMTPTSGAEGTLVTLRGGGMMAVRSISFGGVPATGWTKGDTKIEVRVPPGAKSGNLGIETDGSLCGTSALTWLGSPPVIKNSSANQSVFVGMPAAFSFEAKGTDLKYQWLKESIPIAGATNSTLTIASVQVADASENYSIVVSNGLGTAVGRFRLEVRVMKWLFPTQMEWSSPALGNNGTVYFAAVDKVYAFNPMGDKLWEFAPSGGPIDATPAIGSDGTVYLRTKDGVVFALDGESGAKRWQFDTGRAVQWSASEPMQSSVAIGGNGMVYVGLDAKLYALNSETGQKQWEFLTRGYIVSSPAVGMGGRVYIGSDDGRICAVDGVTGNKHWEFSTGGAVISSPAIGADGTVYFGSNDKWVYALDGATGHKKWEFVTRGKVRSSPAIGADGTVYVGSEDFKIYGLDGKTGAKKWEFIAPGAVSSSPAIGADGTVYVGAMRPEGGSFGRGGGVFGLSGQTGTVTWKFQPPDTGNQTWLSSPIIASDGMLFVGSSSGLYALVTTSKGLVTSAWPARGQNAQRTSRSPLSARQLPIIMAQPSDTTTYSAQTVVLTVQGTGAGPLAYQWYKEGTLISGATSPRLEIFNAQPSHGGDYYVVMRDSQGDVVSAIAKVFVQPINPAPGSVKWVVATGGSGFSSPAIGPDGTVYVESGGYLSALDPVTGRGKWEVSGMNSSPAIAGDGTVYGSSIAVNGFTGKEIWRAGVGSQNPPAIGTNGTIYVSSYLGVQALDSQTGAIKWQSQNLSIGGRQSPALGPDGTIYVAANDMKLHALNGRTGVKKWEFLTGGPLLHSPSLGTNGTVYFGSNDRKVYAVDSQSGFKKWEFLTRAEVNNSPAIGPDGMIYVGAGSSLYALDEKRGGGKRWELEIGRGTESSPAIGADGTVYVGAFDKKVYAVDGQTGAKKWEFLTGGAVRSSPAIASDGTVYVASDDGKLYALVSDSRGGAKGQWPMLGQNAQRTGNSLGILSERPQITTSPSTQLVPMGGTANFVVQANGSIPRQYQWRKNDVAIPGATNSTLTLVSVRSSDAASYTVQISNQSGSVTSLPGQLNIDPLAWTVGALKWDFVTGHNKSASSLGLNDMIYVGSDEKIFALESQNGGKRWEFATGIEAATAPAVGPDGTVFVVGTTFVGSYNGKVYALDGETGERQWEFLMAGPKSASPAVGANAMVYVASGNGNVYGLDTKNGKLKWSFTAGGNIYSPPAVGADGKVYVASQKLYALDGETGVKKWEFAASSGHAPAIASDGTVYFASTDAVYALDGQTGSQLWSSYLKAIRNSPVIGIDGIIYVGSYDRKVHALDPRSGAQVWEVLTSGEFLSFAIGADWTVYVTAGLGTTENARIYALDALTGESKWEFLTESSQATAPTLAADGTLYVGAGARFYALRSTSLGLAPSPWPMHGQNVRHTGRALGPAPVITMQPTSHSVRGGQSVTLSVQASSSKPLVYQWRKDGSRILNATNATYMIASAQSRHPGIYRVLVSNADGGVNSSGATLTVDGATFALEPPDWEVNPGNVRYYRTIDGPSWKDVQAAALSLGANLVTIRSASENDWLVRTFGNVTRWIGFTDEAAEGSWNWISGAPVTYTNWRPGEPNNVGDEDFAAINFGAAGGWNDVKLTDTGPKSGIIESIQSRAVSRIPVIAVQPLDRSISAGASVTFTASANITSGLWYQWRKDGASIERATNATFTLSSIQAADAGGYTVVMSNPAGSVVSSTAILTVNGVAIAPVIIAPPQSQTVTVSSRVILNVTATGNPAPGYQWRKNGVNISGANGATYTIASVQTTDMASYTVVVSNEAGSVTSVTAALTILAPVLDSGILMSANLSVGAPLATPGGGLKGEYWKRPVNSIPADGATNPADRIDTLVKGFGSPIGTFRATKFVYLGNDLTSVRDWLGTDAGSFVGSNNNLDDGAFRFTGFINITHAGSLSLGTSSDDGSRITIGGIEVINNDGVHPDQIVDSTVVFSAPGLYPIEITYFNADWTSDGTGANLNHSGNPDPAFHGGANFHLRVAGADVTSAQVAMFYPDDGRGGTPINPPQITQQPIGASVNAGSSVTFTMTAGGTPPLSYQWRKNGANIAGATSATYSIASAQTADAGSYTVMISNPGGSVTSASANLTVNAPVNVGSVRGDFNSDGLGDLLLQDAGGFLAAWMMNGANLVSGAFLQPNNPGDAGYRVAASGDFNQDGKEDLLFQHTDGTLAVWFMNGTSLASASLLTPSNPGDRNWRVAGVGDLNRDGKSDLVFQHADGTLAGWYMDGIKLSSGVLFNPKSTGDAQWRVVGVGDLNGDAQQDLVFQHTDGTLAVWLLNGTTLTQSLLVNPANPGPGWRLVSVADRNSDGKADLIFQHTNLDLAVWFMDGAKLTSARLLSPSNSGGTWKVVAPR